MKLREPWRSMGEGGAILTVVLLGLVVILALTR